MGDGIYVASKAKHAPLWRAWRDQGAPIVSTWIDEAGDVETTDWSDLWRRCVAEASAAAVTLAYVEPGDALKGALVEVGAALASGRFVLVVGEVDQSWLAHPGVLCGYPLEHLAVALIAAEGFAPRETPRCTGTTARWCPIHGDCTCPDDHTDIHYLNADGCPLHDSASLHGEEVRTDG